MRVNERDFAPNATEFWQLRKIPRTSLRGTVRSCRWLHSDSEANYVKRGNKEFSPESISYEFNNFGYRSDEFHETGSIPALMFIGCSYTLGIGIPWEVALDYYSYETLRNSLGYSCSPIQFGMERDWWGSCCHGCSPMRRCLKAAGNIRFVVIHQSTDVV